MKKPASFAGAGGVAQCQRYRFRYGSASAPFWIVNVMFPVGFAACADGFCGAGRGAL